jgi:nucleotide-binding universal stress UspA family protein
MMSEKPAAEVTHPGDLFALRLVSGRAHSCPNRRRCDVPNRPLSIDDDDSSRAFLLERLSSVQSRLPRLSIGRACLGRPLLAASIGSEEKTTSIHVMASQLGTRAPAVLAEHILVTTDGSDSSDHVIPLALSAIQTCDSQRVTLLRVLTPRPGMPVHALEWAMQRAQAEASLEQFIQRFDAGSNIRDRINPVVIEGVAAEQIVHFAESNDVDLIVIASHGSGDARTWSMGGTSHKVVASGVASVLVVPADKVVSSLRCVLVPLDCSARAEVVLPLAARLAETHQAEIVFVHVVPRPEVHHHLPSGQHERELIEGFTRRNSERAEVYLAQLCARFAGRGISARSEVLVDINPARAIEQLAKHSPCELVLLCAHGSGCHSGERYGSTARRLLDTLVKPLWLVQDLPNELPLMTQSPAGGRARA